MLLDKLKKINGVWWAVILGVVAFLFITGGKILIPTYTDWLMSGGYDPAQHYLGWEFFRHSPMWEWPIGMNPAYGMEVSAAVAHTDSIALLAIIFKHLRWMLPEPFQYTGIWIFLSFILQSIFAWKLLSLFSKERLLPYIGSIFFLIAPIWLTRMGIHNSSFGQWAIVAGLYFYFRKDFVFSHWLAVMVCIGSINTYIFMMVTMLYLADLVQRATTGRLKWYWAMASFAGSSACILAVLYSFGYFEVSKGLASGGFGIFRMNLLSLVDPDGVWSKLIADIECTPGDYEGFNYLGFGMIVLLPVAMVIGLIKIKVFAKARLIPLIVLSLLLFVYALSNKVAYGDQEIFRYDVPESMRWFVNSVRCSGRFFWPVYYLIYLTSFYLIARYLKKPVAAALFSLMLVVQVADAGAYWSAIHKRFNHPYPWKSALTARVWSEFPKHYDKIIYVLPVTQASYEVWLPLADYAVTHGMSINTGYFSRVESGKVLKAQRELTRAVLEGTRDEKALYIFGDDSLWDAALDELSDADACGSVDGFRILAPGFKADKEAHAGDISQPEANHVFDYDIAKGPLSFGPDGAGATLVSGWSVPESWGTWSEGHHSYIFLHLKELPEGDADLVVLGHGFVEKTYPKQDIQVIVNGASLGAWHYAMDDNDTPRSVRIPHDLLASRNGVVLVELLCPDAVSPLQATGANDGRKLALGLKSLEIKPVEAK